ncbi:myo-inositol catabolism protein IolD [Serratia marcescens]|nr:myo-inositol catabolism protein IolD [Serratia marcescens]
MGKIRLTMAQALVRFLDNQYLLADGVETKFVAGIFAIFGHGNVLGLGQALEQDSGDLRVHQGRNEQGMAHAAIASPNRSCVGKFTPAPHRSAPAPPI